MTAGTDHKTFNFIKKGININFILYDTAGYERFTEISKINLIHSNGGIIMYNITNRSSFEKAKYWINEVEENNLPAVLIGNFCDLENERKISKKEGEELAEKNGLHFYESSNRLKINIKEPIDDLIEQILEKREIEKKLIDEKNINEKSNINNNSNNEKKEKKKKKKEKEEKEKKEKEEKKKKEKEEKEKKEKEEKEKKEKEEKEKKERELKEKKKLLKIYENVNYLNNNLKYLKY